MYKKILFGFKTALGLKVELKKLKRPKEGEYWAYSETKDFVHQIYVTNYRKSDTNRGTFGFWVYDEELDKTYKKAVVKLIPYIKWSYQIKYNHIIKKIENALKD